MDEELRSRLYQSLVGLKSSIATAASSRSNCHYNVGQALNQVRDRLVAAIPEPERDFVQTTVPPLEVRVPPKGDLAIWTVSSAEALRLYSQLEPFLEGERRQAATPSKRVVTVDESKKVFLVHGHDDAARETVARFIEKLRLEAIILHEQANSGDTVIEKLEKHAGVRFAIVLLTPGDEGREVGAAALMKRARQNVMLELGYFLGRLGRSCVCALHKGPVEIPSDYLGVVLVQVDDGGGWRLRVAKEMKAAGMQLDMNSAL